MSEHTLVSAIRSTKPRAVGEVSPVATFSALLETVRSQGLLRRRRIAYFALLGGLLIALGGAVVGLMLLRDSWFALLIAVAMGIVFTQFAFFAHEASHRQVFESGRANDRLGRLVGAGLVGMSYQWWMTKHTRHHANPNQIGKDPDITMDAVSFYEEAAATKSGLAGALARRQGYLFFPLLLLEGINLHYQSVKSLTRRNRVDGRALELSIMGGRFAVYLAFVFSVLPLGMAFAFLGVQLAVFGLYMGSTFAPNHKGMPIIPREAKLDFLHKQVLTSRNISGGLPMSALMGGLNYQIEHHLFPSMPRFSLARTRAIVREHCRAHDIPYTETTLPRSFAIVIRYLNEVGLAARDPFDCPVFARYRRV